MGALRDFLLTPDCIFETIIEGSLILAGVAENEE
jgi:hypothetical protein